jgi:hypothetical protein
VNVKGFTKLDRAELAKLREYARQKLRLGLTAEFPELYVDGMYREPFTERWRVYDHALSDRTLASFSSEANARRAIAKLETDLVIIPDDRRKTRDAKAAARNTARLCHGRVVR